MTVPADPAAGSGSEPDEPGLRDLDPAITYDSADDALHRFYVPALGRAQSYGRSVGYFRSSALAVAAKGLSRFIATGGSARFLVGADVAESERQALVGATVVPPELARRLAGELVPADEIARRRLEVLAWLVKEGRLEMCVAIAVDERGTPVPAAEAVPYFHEKLGVLRDKLGDGVAFMGSVNETGSAWTANFESFSVYRSWDFSAPYFDKWSAEFERRWAGTVPGFRVFPMPEAIEQALVALAPDEPPPSADPEERAPRASRRALARFLAVAPQLIGAEGLAEATSAVTLFAHQRKVAERLAGAYPRSWLVADEVGLGKTISAGVALRRLLLAGDAERVLVLAPAGVCRQWQDELFERFGLWVPRLDAGRIHGAHPDDVTPVAPGINPYAEHPVLIVSSHLARRRPQRELMLAAPRLDLLVVDEAHHARRRGADRDERRPTRLLQLLDGVTAADHAAAVWLLTATPMQIDAIELVDLLAHVGLTGPLAEIRQFERFYATLGADDATTDWPYLHRMLERTPAFPLDAADTATLEAARARVGPVATERIARFGRLNQDPSEIVGALDKAGREELRAWIRKRSPIGQLLTRHTRQTLRHYRAQGLLDERIAERDVETVTVPFTASEQLLYDGLDGLLGRLMDAHGSRRGAGFILTIYRRRLTSSWAAIRKTLRRRLAREGFAVEDDFWDEFDDEDDDEGRLDDVDALPLSAEDTARITAYLDELDTVPDSKFDRLSIDIAEARGSGHAVVVFTQFTDTLEYLRDRLQPAYRSHLATYTGEGAAIWTDDEGWLAVAKQELVEALDSRRVSVVLATDAASEGLNLQSASHLVNYDLPWNPMRVEQRIGRIDRIGQRAPVIRVRNYVIPDTVEESVYRALATRIDVFAGLIGRLQPILGATERTFRHVFRCPSSERPTAIAGAIEQLLRQADDLNASGLDLDDEDLLPAPIYADPPVTLASLDLCLTDELEIDLGRGGRPTTTDGGRVSHDRERWCALATFGHPSLLPVLEKLIASIDEPSDESLLVRQRGPRAVAVRADRTPPETVRRLDDIEDLGPALAAGEADATANALLTDALNKLEACRRAVEIARRDRWLRLMRVQFRTLVTTTVRAEQALRMRDDGEAPSALEVWLWFLDDETSPWRNADLFRQHLGIDLDDLLPRGGPGAEDRSSRHLAQQRVANGEALARLIGEFSSVMFPAPAEATPSVT